MYTAQSKISYYKGINSIKWSQAASSTNFPGRSGHTSVVFNNKIWLIGGWSGDFLFNDVWYSENGTDWTCAVKSAGFIPRTLHSSVVFANRIWVIGGLYFDKNMDIRDLNDVWYSEDGSTWIRAASKAEFDPRGGHSVVVFNNRLWLIGGIACKGEVWYTTNGNRWHLATDSAAFGSRGGHAAIVFKNRLWVIGGIYVDKKNIFHSLSDVWYSDNGTDWYKSVDKTSFFAGGGHSCVHFNNMLLVIGGYRKSGAAFVSKDGMNWHRIDEAASLGERVTHNCVVFKNRVWVIGGYDGSGHKNDVWYTGKEIRQVSQIFN